MRDDADVEAEVADVIHRQAELARDMAAVAAEHGRDALAAQLREAANNLER